MASALEQQIKGRWTYELIPELNEWIKEKHGELDYNLTQMLAGHAESRRSVE